MECLNQYILISGLKLALPHVQSAWELRRENVRPAGLTTYCNNFSKKKKIIIEGNRNERNIVYVLKCVWEFIEKIYVLFIVIKPRLVIDLVYELSY